MARLAAVAPEASRPVLRRRRSNRRVAVQRKPLLLWIADGVTGIGRILWIVIKALGQILVAAALVVGLVWGGRLAVRHVIDSPRFALGQILVSPTTHVSEAEIRELAGVEEGERLLAVDTDALAAQIARHPWVQSVRVRRQLPGTLAVDVVERRAAGAVALGGLYLVDEAGRPFKRATMAEAEGLPVITGIGRDLYVGGRDVVEAVFREALALATAYAARPGRPPLSEINVDARYGFTLYLLDGGAEIRLGRGDLERKLARLDQIFEAVKASAPKGLGAMQVVHLDGGDRARIPVRLAASEPVEGEGVETAAKPAAPAKAAPKKQVR